MVLLLMGIGVRFSSCSFSLLMWMVLLVIGVVCRVLNLWELFVCCY